MIKYLNVLIVAMSPIFELRGAIPLAMMGYKMSPTTAFCLGVFGNFLPVIVLLKYLQKIVDFLSSRSKMFKSFFDWLFKRTHTKHNKGFEMWGAIALISFVAIPLPFTGAYTGVIASFIFDVPPKKAMILIFVGVVLSGLITTLSTMGVLLFI